MNVKFLDLNKINQRHISKFNEVFNEIVNEGYIVLGENFLEIVFVEILINKVLIVRYTLKIKRKIFSGKAFSKNSLIVHLSIIFDVCN